ncbi:hypothetical protein [Roseomonas indoligenes]|uniref:Uncharacterized protein n=1 Tax=Roseomonas indoligenes TaxID=2820811 RepID=A0A940MXD5_9PROT|nr:hypothetical protein [Pararoseomonas indoligenes]MBP0492735.1 hypothetical protein [Pararoseomonas indoligenes]
MTRSLLIAIVGALLGFAGWIWLTGPGTSVPNALIALVCAIACGRLAWWLAALVLPESEVPPPAPIPPPTGRRAPPPADAAPWRKPEGRD